MIQGVQRLARLFLAATKFGKGRTELHPAQATPGLPSVLDEGVKTFQLSLENILDFRPHSHHLSNAFSDVYEYEFGFYRGISVIGTKFGEHVVCRQLIEIGAVVGSQFLLSTRQGGIDRLDLPQNYRVGFFYNLVDPALQMNRPIFVQPGAGYRYLEIGLIVFILCTSLQLTVPGLS